MLRTGARHSGEGVMAARRRNTVELFRKALMERHAEDWDMETISEAAHICAEATEVRHG